MSEPTIDAAAIVDLRLARDGVTIDAGERERLISLVPVALDWMRHLNSLPELRYAEPALTNPLVP